MFLTSEEIIKKANGRQIIFWGASEDWVPKSKRLLPDVDEIVDINNELIGKEIFGCKIISSKSIEPKDNYVVITSGSIDSVEENLYQYKFKQGEDYCYSPVFRDFHDIQRFKDLNVNLIFSSSDYGASKGNRGSRLGGGLFKCNINYNDITYEKVYEGSVRGFKIYNEKIFCIDYVKNSLVILNKNYEIENEVLLKSRHLTGIDINEESIFVASSADDIILIYSSKDFSLTNTLKPKRHSMSNEGKHHLNDISLHENGLLYSYFSNSGMWRNEIFDGGIDYYDFNTGNIDHIVSNMMQPHSPCIIENQLHFCESPYGNIYNRNNNILVTFDGFVRGLDFYNGLYIVGQSETLYMSRIKHKSKISLNSGFHIYNQETKLTKLYPVNGIKNIHSFISV
jgi:hypothetical protein